MNAISSRPETQGDQGMGHPAPLNISQIDRAQQLYPVLAVFPNPGDRDFVPQQQ